MLPGRHRIPYHQALRSKEEGCPAGSRLPTPRRSRPFRSDALPAQLLRQANRARGHVGQDPSNPAPTGGHCSGELPQCALQVRNRPAAGATDGKTTQEHAEDAATGRPRRGRGLTAKDDRGAGSAFGRVRACGSRRPVPPRIAAFRQAAPAARPASCAPRPHCEHPGRHYAASRSSPWHCGWSPRCPAAYRKQRMEIRSRRGAAR